MKKQKIEDIFSSMEDFSSVPPPELWGQIEERLDKPKKKKRAILWWSAAACLLLGLLLPSVLHFSSNDSGIKVNNSIPENNNVVLDQKKNEENKEDQSRTIENRENILKKQSVNSQITSSEKGTNQSTNSQLKQNQKAVSNKAVFPDKANLDPLASKLNSGKNIVNNNTASGKNVVPASENAFISVLKNKAVVEKSYIPNKADSFNSDSRYKLSDNEKTNADKILAEKTFTAGKQNKFNTASSKNQLSNSIFEDKSNSKNNKNIAFSPSNSSLYEKQTAVNSNKEKQNTNKTTADKSIVSVQKDNSKGNSFTNTGSILSKQDSVQLAELQNLEKGIVTPKEEDKKDEKSLSKADKWALQLFAGVANSENYRNSKTLGNVNDSKQGSSYGVKTQYKINNKWAVASGFKINELGQSVANVSYLSSKNTAFFGLSDYYYTQNSPVQQIASNSDYILVSNNAKENLKSENIETGNLDQNLRYFEMPLEVSYSVFNKNKTSINLNTGGFVGRLISNTVSLDGNSIGENVDAKDYVYGSTLSSTIQYRVYKKTNVFVEPAVNYYINPLNTQSFNQFQWGLNFGMNVSF